MASGAPGGVKETPACARLHVSGRRDQPVRNDLISTLASVDHGCSATCAAWGQDHPAVSTAPANEFGDVHKVFGAVNSHAVDVHTRFSHRMVRSSIAAVRKFGRLRLRVKAQPAFECVRLHQSVWLRGEKN